MAVKITLNLYNKTGPELASMGEMLVEKGTASETLRPLTAGLDIIKQKVIGYRTAETRADTAKKNWQEFVAIANVKQKELADVITEHALDVTKLAGNDVSVVIAAGFSTRAKRSASAEPRQPTGFHATMGDRDGQVDLSWDGQRNMKFLAEYAPHPATEGTMKKAGLVGKSKITVKNLISGTLYDFQITVYNANEQSAVSEIITKMAP